MLKKYNILLCYFLFQVCYCDWVSEWLTPIRDQYKESGRRMNKIDIKMLDGDKLKLFSGSPEVLEIPRNNLLLQTTSNMTPVNVLQTQNLRVTLETILGNAKKLADSLKAQISIVQEKEERLKDTIVNGRFGITTLTVSTLRKLPKNYIIRDGYWTLCNGILQHPTTQEVTAAAFSDLYAVPRCIGQEVTSKPDPCVFNSVIKYDTIPSQKRPEYSEDEYLCLKPTFNTTLEQYFSVTKHIVNQTCKSGVIRSMADNVLECGVRVLSDYTYYPNKEVTSYLPLEYCEGTQGSCNLIVAWHLSNSSVENFEFIKDDLNFKNYFMKSATFLNNALY
ncbi:uncharacterized protein LOC123722184 isoform X1 [Papilio machaon]|uniref:uncharacterized protein LOC123722184 isoform X1 n=2 Tax=Papilio machaon TaxID=76193 RepID=UPI001E663CC9|nr:uncharacterized protein LOC123722184 isoform X1 [Papilio machaon]